MSDRWVGRLEKEENKQTERNKGDTEKVGEEDEEEEESQQSEEIAITVEKDLTTEVVPPISQTE